MTPKLSVWNPPIHSVCIRGRERPDQAVPGQGLSRDVGGASAIGRPDWASPGGCLGVLTAWRPLTPK